MTPEDWKANKSVKNTELEDDLAGQMKLAAIPTPEREHRFWPGRRHRFDFAWIQHNLAVEVEGGTWNGGRHVTGKGFESDVIKYNEAAIRGWVVLRFTAAMVHDGRALVMIERAFGRE